MASVNRDIWETCSELWNRSTGGTNVAARPEDDVEGLWPSAPAPAGVDSACRWLRTGLEAPSAPRFLFLVGGPGAGKSHASAMVTAGLDLNSGHQYGAARRRYNYSNDNGRLVVINDATIVEDGEPAPLAGDIRRVITEESHLLACVNRGILIEERAALRRSNDVGWSPELAVLSWLQGVDLSAADTVGQDWHVHEHSSGEFLKTARLMHEGREVSSLAVVYVDVCSLFEEQPRVANPTNDLQSLRYKRYRPALLQERQNLPLDEMPAAMLLETILGKFDNAPSGEGEISADPIAANVSSLRSRRVRSGLMTIARAAEIAASARMTYRELWGLWARAIVGDAPSFLAADSLKPWIVANQPRSGDPIKDFEQIKRLARLRFSQAIFGGGDSDDRSLRDPVLRFTRTVDPVRDVVPGRGEESTEGWASPVLSAFEDDSEDGSPLVRMLKNDTSNLMSEVVSDFDRAVDSQYRLAIASGLLSEVSRREAVSWYSNYLTRLFAVSHGYPAFRKEISLWLLARNRIGKTLPDELKSLETLIRPMRFPASENNVSLLPLYASRTEPIIGKSSKPKLALRFSSFRLETALNGEDIILHLVDDGQRVGSLHLDFAIIREALACEQGNVGITDLIDSTAPRLERIRASRMISRHLESAEYAVVTAVDDRQIILMEE